MIIAKIFFIILLLIIFFLIFRIKYSYQIRIIEKIILTIFFAIAFVVILNPAILDKAAKFLNIDRGRDLLFYLYMLFSSWGLIRSHIKINYQSSRIKKVISELALKDFDGSLKKKNK